MSQIIPARSLAEVVALADDPPLELCSSSSSISTKNTSRKTLQDEQQPLVLYIVRVPGSKDIFLTTMKPLQKVVTAADVSCCLYYVHFDCVGEGEEEEEGDDRDEEERDRGKDEVEHGNGKFLPLRTQPSEISRSGRANEGERKFLRKSLQLSETSQNENINGNGYGHGHGHGNGYTHRGIMNPNEPNFQRKPLQSSEINQYRHENQVEYDRSQLIVETSGESKFRRKPVPPARREKAFGQIDQQAYFQPSTDQNGAMRTGQRSAPATAFQDADSNIISSPQSSFRPSIPRPFGPHMMGQRHHPTDRKGMLRENTVGTPNSTSTLNSNFRGIPELPPRPPPRSPLVREHEGSDEGYKPRSSKATPIRNHETESNPQSERSSNSNRIDHAATNNGTKSRDSPRKQHPMSLTLIRRHAGSQWNVGKIYRTAESTTHHRHHHRHLNGASSMSIDRSIADDRASSNTIMRIDILTPGYQKFNTQEASSSSLTSSSPPPPPPPSVPSNPDPQQQPQQHIPTNPAHESEPSHSKVRSNKPFRRQIQIQPSSFSPSPLPPPSTEQQPPARKPPDSSEGRASISNSSLLRIDKLDKRTWRSSFDFHRIKNRKRRTDKNKTTSGSQDQDQGDREDEQRQQHLRKNDNNNYYYYHDGVYTGNSSSSLPAIAISAPISTRNPLPPSSPSSSSSPSPSTSSSYTFLTPWNTTCEFTSPSSSAYYYYTHTTRRRRRRQTLLCKHRHHTGSSPSIISELRFNLPPRRGSRGPSWESSLLNPKGNKPNAGDNLNLNPKGNNPSNSNQNEEKRPTNQSDMLMLALAHDPLGGGASGKEAKLGKVVILGGGGGGGRAGRGKSEGGGGGWAGRGKSEGGGGQGGGGGGNGRVESGRGDGGGRVNSEGEEEEQLAMGMGMGIGMKMLDLLVAANVGLFWGVWDGGGGG